MHVSNTSIYFACQVKIHLWKVSWSSVLHLLSAFAFFSYVYIGEKCRHYKKYVYLWPKYNDDCRIGHKYINNIYKIAGSGG